jgi:hypothetical protein
MSFPSSMKFVSQRRSLRAFKILTRYADTRFNLGKAEGSINAGQVIKPGQLVGATTQMQWASQNIANDESPFGIIRHEVQIPISRNPMTAAFGSPRWPFAAQRRRQRFVSRCTNFRLFYLESHYYALSFLIYFAADEYRKTIGKDAALERRFQPVTIDEPTVGSMISILTGFM